MNARLERKLRLLAAIVIGAIGFVLARGFTSPVGVEIGILYGLILSVAIGGISQFVLEGPMRGWLGGLSFTASLMVRSAIYAAIIAEPWMAAFWPPARRWNGSAPCCRLPFVTSGGFRFADAPMASTWSVLTSPTGARKVSPRS